jgi:hypothetical protein
MLAYPLHRHIVMATHITGVHDVNRNQTLQDDDFALVKDWADSLAALSLQGVLFHNNFSAETIARYQSENLLFVAIEPDPSLSPNVLRYLIYRDFLQAHEGTIDALFVTDVSDVVACRNPFVESLFVEHSNTLFCGDEPKPLENPWMTDHAAHLRSQIADYAAYEAAFASATLLNCGIIGGTIEVMQGFLAQLSAIHDQYNRHNPTLYTGDMGAFNYLVRTQYNDRLLHGFPCNTVFKAYESDRTDCWFRHK